MARAKCKCTQSTEWTQEEVLLKFSVLVKQLKPADFVVQIGPKTTIMLPEKKN
jgi:hypothetical protein